MTGSDLPGAPFYEYAWPECNYGGRSSVGRAPDCDSGGRGFEPRRPPHILDPGDCLY
jgi:hypothetical protein